MRKLLTLFFILMSLIVKSQNEFAATAFYNDVRKILADAKEGFPKYRGGKEPGTGLLNIYRIKLLLPLADSGYIIFPSSSNPYAEFFFQVASNKNEIDQRAVNLQEAIITAYGKPLYTRTETATLNDLINSTTYFFEDATDNNAIFKSNISQQRKRRYCLSLRIIGNLK